MEEDGFILVRNGKRRQQFAYPKHKDKASKILPEEPSISIEDVNHVMKWAQKLMDGSTLPDWLNGKLEEIFKNQKLASIRAIGVGSFHSKSHFGSIQLALVQALRKKFPQVKIVFQDPIINAAEKSWLVAHEISVLPPDDLLKNPVANKDSITLCFMPHCEHFMYNNLLISYWSLETLRNLVLIGNNLLSFMESCDNKHVHEIPAISYFSKNCIYVPFTVCDEFPYAFSDTCLMYLNENVSELSVDLKDFVPDYCHFKPVI